MATQFPPLDFEDFHRRELPERLRAGNGALATRGPLRLGSIAFRRKEGGAFTYLPREQQVDVVAGEDADTVIEVTDEIWQNIVNELDAAAGLLYGNRARCLRGNALNWLNWEPALRAMFHGRPIYDPGSVELPARNGGTLDPEATFTLADDREEMTHFLSTAGYLFVRNVFSGNEIAAFLAEAAELREEARPGDKLSWWGKGPGGRETLCRVTRAAAKPALASIPSDTRMLSLKDLSEEELAHRARASSEEGVSLIFKHPEMKEGLGDLPWHRDCGMGGHAIACPSLVASVFLTRSTPESGDLRFLPGSWKAGCAPIDAAHPRAPRGACFAANPGDVSLHYGDTMHAAPPPQGRNLEHYRVSAVTGYARPQARPHRGRHYNEVLHRREDGQIEHLSKLDPEN